MSSEIKVGTVINSRYLIKKLLGQGGFGRTYLAFDNHRFGDPCVLKEFLPTTSNAQVLRKCRELFEREARVLYQIEHPQIPKFLALLTENERLFIVQEYIDGQNYAQILSERLQKRGKPFSETEVKAWLLNMLPILEFIHERKIIHRDISLENIMLPHNQSQPILIDFGVVKEKLSQIFAADSGNEHYSDRGSVVGKVGYSPPEQLRLGQCYASSDLYALAVCAIVLLTGKMPYILMDNSLNWKWRSYVKVSDAFGKIIEKMLAEKPSDRYQSAKEVYAELSNNSNIVPSEKVVNQLGNNQQNLQQENQITSLPSVTPVSINQEFLEYCQRELASFVGPLASFLVKHTLNQTSQEIAQAEFIEALSKSIPDSQRAQEFKNSMKVTVIKSVEKIQPVPNPQENFESYPAISDPDFLEACRRELNSFVGPFGSVILKDTLDNYPNLTREELIEALVAEIPHEKKATKFKESIYKLKLR